MKLLQVLLVQFCLTVALPEITVATPGNTDSLQTELGRLTALLETRPDSADLWRQRADCHLDLDEIEKAIAACNRAIQLDSLNAKAFNCLGAAYGKLNQLPSALANYKRAADLDPEYFGYFANLAYTYARMDSIERAIENYTRALEINPDDISILFYRGNQWVRSGNTSNAIEDFNMVHRCRRPCRFCNRDLISQGSVGEPGQVEVRRSVRDTVPGPRLRNLVCPGSGYCLKVSKTVDLNVGCPGT